MGRKNGILQSSACSDMYNGNGINPIAAAATLSGHFIVKCGWSVSFCRCENGRQKVVATWIKIRSKAGR